MSFICGGEYRLGSTGSTLLGYRRGCRWAIGRVRAAGEGRKGLRATVYVCTGMAGSTLLLTLGWIVFTEVSSSSRSGSGSAAGISWCSGIVFYFSRADDPRGNKVVAATRWWAPRRRGCRRVARSLQSTWFWAPQQQQRLLPRMVVPETIGTIINNSGRGWFP